MRKLRTDYKNGENFYAEDINLITGAINDTVDAVNSKQGILTAGNNIEITNTGTISVTGITEPIASDFDIKDLSDTTGLRDTWSGKQDALTAGANISISGNIINAEGYTFNPNLDSIAEGYSITEYPPYTNIMNEANGLKSHAEGAGCVANGIASHAEGAFSTADGIGAHAEGGFSVASGAASHAEGGSIAIGDGSHAEGGPLYSSIMVDILPQEYGYSQKYIGYFDGIDNYSNEIIDFSFVIYDNSYENAIFTREKEIVTLSDVSYVIFNCNAPDLLDYLISIGDSLHCSYSPTKALGYRSHAEGSGTKTNSESSHAEGYSTVANGYSSHAEGYSTVANGEHSHAEGKGTTTQNDAEHAEGRYNISHKSNDYGGDSGNTQHSIGIGTSSSDTKNAFEVMQNGDIYALGIGGYQGTNTKVQDASIKTMQGVITDINTSVAGKQDALTAGDNIEIDSAGTISVTGITGQDLLVETTYSELKSLCDNGELVPGQLYRITDYVATTTQEGTRSAGHAFDIIVTALSDSKLSEEAKAIAHDGDTYFENCELSAWELKYCLDNDTSRFAWADETNGKGVIYRMVDENNNDVPYDFKNIQFIRYKKVNSSDSLFDGSWQGPWCSGTTISDFKYHYTFCGAQPDYSEETDTIDSTVIESITNRAANNTIHPYSSFGGDEYSYGSAKIVLNNIVFNANYPKFNYCGGSQGWDFNTTQTSNILGIGCHNMTFNGRIEGNVFMSDCCEFTVQSDFHDNTFGSMCRGNTIGYSFCYNNIGNKSSGNKIGNYFGSNTIGNYFGSNTIGNYFGSNTIGNNFDSNTIGNDVYNNTIGDSAYGNTIESRFVYNTIRNSFRYNTIGNNFQYNRFGEDVQHLDFTTNYGSVTLQYLYVLSGYKYNSKTSVPTGITADATYSQTIGFNTAGSFVVKNMLD